MHWANNTFWIHSPSSHLDSSFLGDEALDLISGYQVRSCESWDRFLGHEVEITNGILMKKTFVPFTWLRIAKNVKIWFVSKSKLSKQNKVFKFKSKKAFWMKSWTWSNTQLPLWEVLILNIWMFQKKFWWPQWKHTNVTLLYVTLMVSSNQTSSQSVMVTRALGKCRSRKWKKSWLPVSKMVNSSGVKTKT